MSDHAIYVSVKFMFDYKNCVIKSFKCLYMYLHTNITLFFVTS